MRAGFPVDEDALAYDVIAAVGPGGNYLSQPHTIARCRTEFWKPAICDRRGLAGLGRRRRQGRGGPRHRPLARSCVADHEDPAMDADARRRLDDYLESRI